MDISHVLCILCKILNIAVSADASLTIGVKPTNPVNPTYFLHKHPTVINTTKDTDRFRSITQAKTTQHVSRSGIIQSTNINLLKQKYAELIYNISGIKTENGSIRISDFSECLKNSAVKKSATVHLHAQSSDQVYLWECHFVPNVNSHQVVRFQTHECLGNNVLKHSDYSSSVKQQTDSTRCILSEIHCPARYSLTDAVLGEVFVPDPYPWGRIYCRMQPVSLSFSAVNQSERRYVELQLAYLSSSSGYIRSPEIVGSTPCRSKLIECTTLSRPPGYIIFLTKLIRPEFNHVHIVLGQCGSKRYLKFGHLHFLFPDFFGEVASEERDMSVSFSTAVEITVDKRFKLRFSFHSKTTKPYRVPGLGTWNCSVSVWPDLFKHFPMCDLISQCAEHEDEAHCPYTTEKCGPGKIEIGGRCYIYNITERGLSRRNAQKECQRHGAALVSLETTTEVYAFREFTNSNDKMTEYWVGLTSTRLGNPEEFINDMYAFTLRWESGYVAYFLPQGTRFYISCYGWHAQNLNGYICESTYFGFVCEFPLLSHHYHKKTPVTIPVLSSMATSGVHLDRCPKQHLTHQLLACDVKSQCRGLENTDTWYRATCSMSRGLTQPYFYCDMTHEFVPYSLVCDFRQDCLDGRDEDFCVYPACKGDMFACGNGQCVYMNKRCDGLNECFNNYDESDCSLLLKHIFHEISPPAVINFDLPGKFTITPLPENSTQCPETHFQCHDDGYCLPVYVRCNDIIDCPDHEDEVDCDDYKLCSGYYRCLDRKKTICMHVNHLCDGVPQCPLHDDELTCNTVCPDSCVCYGLAFICNHAFLVSSFPQVRYLDAKGSGMPLSDIMNNTMLIHLGVQACGWRTLTDVIFPNIHSVDLSENLLHSVSFSQLVGMPQLRILSLAGNPMSAGIAYGHNYYVHQLMTIFNVSHIQVNSLNISSLLPRMPKLQVLDLTGSKIKVLQGNCLCHNLQVLNLQGCPVTDFAPDFMKSMVNLRYVLTDNFKLCCSAVLPNNFQGKCLAPFNEISSCDDLLKSIAYRCAHVVFAILSVLGNVGGFVYRVYFLSETTKTGFAIFVLHLCISDFLMGVYLIFIGVADRIYTGAYIWNDTEWKHSAACSIAGFLAMLSCELSAFIICLITFDRFLVLHFPFSHIRFGPRSAHIACVIMWTLGLTLAAIPLLPVTSHWEFFHQKDICIPLPVTRAEFPGHIYSFSVMIICNLILFLTIGIGQFLIYWSVRSNTIYNHLTKPKDIDTDNARSKEVTIAIRLLSVAVSDFLCWFPIGLCGVLAAIGVVIPGEVNVGMAIFVLPLNSALNPFLYTLSIILEKRRKARELCFQKMLQTVQNQ